MLGGPVVSVPLVFVQLSSLLAPLAEALQSDARLADVSSEVVDRLVDVLGTVGYDAILKVKVCEHLKLVKLSVVKFVVKFAPEKAFLLSTI